MLEDRLRKLREHVGRKKLDALLVTNTANVFYLSGFTGSTAALVVTCDDAYILVDPRYTVQAASECELARVKQYSGNTLVAAASELVNELKLGKVGYEADTVTVSSYRQLRKLVDRSIALRSTKDLVENLRRIKDSREISLIRTAAGIADAAFESVVLGIVVGMTEKELALLIDSALRRMGADKEAFESIAASGPNSARPHAKPTDRILKAGDFVKMDFGARYATYNSDITRTVCLGKPSKKQREVYRTVLDAQLAAIDAIGPGKNGREIDSVARNYISSKGYGANFGHALGHGLGISVHDHEALSQTSDLVLAPGMVVTVEPGIYIEGWGGVRIEDDVLVTECGAEVLTKAGKQLTSI